MDAQRYEQVYELFTQLRRESAEARSARLAQVGADDPALRQEVEALLAAHDHPLRLDFAPGLDLCQAIPEGAETRFTPPAPSHTPERIGHYVIRRLIASGGMGVVYEAVQERPHRTVALKVLRSGIASRSALRRFEHESQLLGRLRHPNIAQVYEAGVHDDGTAQVPYFAMEYIPHPRTMLEYAAEQHLDHRRCLRLFVKVCEAVHHGHQRGIIHRDLKPGNILVDGSGEPKIIDFGVARATDADMALTTLQTMANLALLYTRDGRYDDAEPLNVQALAIRRRVLGDTHPNTIFSIMNLAFFYASTGRFADAVVLEAEAIDHARSIWPKDSWLIGAFLADHGRTLLNLQRFQESESALLEGHAILSSARGPDFPKTVDAITSLAALYEAWDVPEKAQAWRAKLPSESPDLQEPKPPAE